MTSAPISELCRITVYGPNGRVDLAVPLSTTVSALLPTLLEQVVRDEEQPVEVRENGSWVLQQLGGAPLDANGTPETLGWLDGEQFHLVPADDPLPELDFDDIADGMATAINRRSDRWNAEINHRFFLGVCAAVLVTIALGLFLFTSQVAASITAGAFAVVLVASSVVVSHTRGERALASILGFAGCGYAGICGAVAVAGPAGASGLELDAVLVGALVVLVVSAVPFVLQRTFMPKVTTATFGVAGIVALGAILSLGLRSGMALTVPQSSALLATVFVFAMVFVAKIATRFARLRGPQLPRTADELQVDLAPAPAAEVVERTGAANEYLSMLAVGAALVLLVSFHYLLAEPGWVVQLLAGLLCGLILLRTREFLDVAQRLALASAGTYGAILLVISLLTGTELTTLIIGLVLLMLIMAFLVMAALRAAPRRLLPIWPHLANILETCTALAVIPFLLQLLGVYAWARGLAG